MSGDAGQAGSAAARADQARQTATAFVHSIYRLVKSCSLHSDTNQAVVKAATGATVLVADLAQRSDVDAVTILFTPNAVFVNGRMLKMTRETFALAAELGTMLEVCDVTEITLAKDVPPVDLARLARMVADAQRDKALGPKLREAELTGVRVRKVKGLGADSGRRDDATPAGRAVRTFAQSVIVMREFYAALRAGDRTLPNRVKRIAQKLVAHAEDDARRLVTLAVAAPPDPGHAGLSVSGTVIAVAMGRQLTNDRRVLGSLAQAALLYDAGRARLLGEGEGLAADRALSEDELDRTPASAVHVLTSIGRIHQPAMARNVIAYEALRLRRQDSLGLAYGGRRPTSLAAHVLATARAFIELRSYQPGMPGVGIDEAIQLLLGRAADAQQRTVVKLLVGALGIFPAGTLVELSTGEQAVVLATPALPVDFARPPVRILYDAKARLLDDPFERDLAATPPPGEPRRLIRRTIDADQTQMKAMRAYVASTASARRRVDSPTPSPEAARRTYDQHATTDVMRHGRASEASGARLRGPHDALTPAPSADRDRAGRLASPRLGSPVPSTQGPRSPVPSPRGAADPARASGPATPSPRTLPPIRHRPSHAPSDPVARGSDPRGDTLPVGRLGALDGRPDDARATMDDLPVLDTGLPIAGPPSSRARQPAWAAPSTEPPATSRSRSHPPEPFGDRGARSLSPAAGLRIPDAPRIYETPAREPSVDLQGRADVEYEPDGTTRQASWNEFRELLDLGAATERSAPPSPRRATGMNARIDALDLADDALPRSDRAARTADIDVSEPTRAGGLSAYDRLLAEYLADDSADDPDSVPRDRRPTPVATPAVRSPTPVRAPGAPISPGSRPPRLPSAPSHGLRWGHDDPAPPDPEASTSSRDRSSTRPDGK